MKIRLTLDGNEAAARMAYATNEVVAIYPITPSSTMGELADQWASQHKPNLWGDVPQVVQMQSEAGVAGALHGALQAGSLATTFTASQGLLLMIPNLYKWAGELTPTVVHVAARAVATHALSIFGDHSDVMGIRQCGCALLSSNSVQEAMDFALISQTATLESRIPFVHFFDGFRTSHEVAKVQEIPEDVIRAMTPEERIREHRERALTPDRPVLRGTAQNPDVFFQAREACNPFYLACPEIVQSAMDRFAELTGRAYKLFDYNGDPDAEHVIVIMGSGAEVSEETLGALRAEGRRTGVLKVRLFRPFSVRHFLSALPATVRSIAVLDRTKEPGAIGEPLYQDIVTAIQEGITSGEAPFREAPRVVGGRYGLSSKDFTPAMVKSVFDTLATDTPRNHFTVGIQDDVSQTSLAFDPSFSAEDPETVRAVFYGLGSDGTVGANKNTIKIIGEETDLHAQGYFVFDSKKSGSTTVSHLRFGPNPIRAPYLIGQANFVACHQFTFLDQLDVLAEAAHGATFLLNAPYPPEEVWDNLPVEVQETILEKELRLYSIDAQRVASEAGMGRRINTVMQACFFALSGVLPREDAIASIKAAIKKTYGKRGESVVKRNFDAVDMALENLHEVGVPVGAEAGSTRHRVLGIRGEAPPFVKQVISPIVAGKGDLLPVSAFAPDGTFPTGTSQYEKRNIANELPVWDPDLCIQCGKCVMACPHSVIRTRLYTPELLGNAPEGFQHAASKFPDRKSDIFTLQITPEDCTGCRLCVEVCPVKDKKVEGRRAINMAPLEERIEVERENWDFFKNLPQNDRHDLNLARAKDIQLADPLFEFSGACGGCGETPYLKLMTQLFGDRTLIANATGCSSIFGGNLPTTPWTVNSEGRGPAWSNSLFEDNAEFGLGMRLALDQHLVLARHLLQTLAPKLPGNLATSLIESKQEDDKAVDEQRQRVKELRSALAKIDDPEARRLDSLADYLVRKTVWIVGGDGWAYDIGYGGLDHVLALGRDVNVLVLDTEVYSNTGGQASKATPRGAVARFASGGKRSAKKDLVLLAMTYGNIYVARIAMGANDNQAIKAFREAESYPGASLIVSYGHCIAHGLDMHLGFNQQKAAVESGAWPLMRFDPRRRDEGLNPLQLDSKPPRMPLEEYLYSQGRFRQLQLSDPETAAQLLEEARQEVQERYRLYQQLAAMDLSGKDGKEDGKADRNGSPVAASGKSSTGGK